jgi:lipopolysaccharide export system permease protein
MTLNRYIAMRFAGTFLRVLGVFMVILFVIDIIEQVRVGQGTDQTLGQAAFMAVLNAPRSIYAILPLVMILSAITSFLGFSRSSELVVIRAAGRSGMQFLAVPLIVSLLIGMICVTALNPIAAATYRAFQVRDAERWAKVGGQTVLSVTEGGLWLRQGDDQAQVVIHADRAAGGTSGFQNVRMLFLAPDGRPLRRIEAASARLETPDWVLGAARAWDLSLDNPEANVQDLPPGTRLPTDLTEDRIRDGFGEPRGVSIWDLPAHIDNLERAGLSARPHRVQMQMELALPVLLAAMVMVAAGFSMRHARAGKTGQLVLMALTAGFGIFFLRNFAQVLGDNGQIPVFVAAWIPPVAAALGSLGLLLHLEDG